MKYLVIDVETSKKPVMNPWQTGSFIVAIGYCIDDGPITTHLLRHNTAFVRPWDVALLETQAAINAADVIVAHNVKFDINWLKSIGLKFEGKKFWCTCTADYLMQGQFYMPRKLNDVAARYRLGCKLDEVEKYWNEGYETDEIPSDILLAYLAQDVALTRDVYKFQAPVVLKNELLPLAELTFEVADMLSDMELLGASFDEQKANMYVEDYKQKLKDVDSSIFKFVGYEFNISSTAQLSACLYGGYVKKKYRETYTRQLKNGTKTCERWAERFEEVEGLGFKPLDGSEGAKAGQYSTGKKVIALLYAETPEQKSFLSLLLERSKIDKIIEMFITTEEDSGLLKKIGNDGRIHPSFNQSITVTGRLSSSNPNGQNLPRKGGSPIKHCFTSVNGVIVNVDLAQIEFRVAAELSRDPVMLKEIWDGIDVHADNAIRFFGAGKYQPGSKEFNDLRQVAKIFTFRLLYGGSANGFHRDGSMPRLSLAKWKSIVEAYYKKYSGLRRWQQSNVGIVQSRGYLRNPSGRVLKFRLSPQHGVICYKESAIYNYPVQSSSADIMYLSMAHIRRAFKEAGIKSQIILQVHDSLVIDAFPNEVETIADLAITTFRNIPKLCKEYWNWDMAVPFDGDVEIGPTYGDIVKFNHVPNATSCTLKFTDGSAQELNVTKYIDLCTNKDYLNLTAERKLAKITFQ